MKFLKDFFYDKNDILIALIILLLAAGLIFWRMEIIMDYPETLAEQAQTENNTAEETDTPDAGAFDGGLWTNGTLIADVTVTVAGGSATEAVQSLIDAQLFESYEQFSQICSAAGYSPENIKATTFTFAAGCTQTDIAKQVTQ